MIDREYLVSYVSPNRLALAERQLQVWREVANNYEPDTCEAIWLLSQPDEHALLRTLIRLADGTDARSRYRSFKVGTEFIDVTTDIQWRITEAYGSTPPEGPKQISLHGYIQIQNMRTGEKHTIDRGTVRALFREGKGIAIGVD